MGPKTAALANAIVSVGPAAVPGLSLITDYLIYAERRFMEVLEIHVFGEILEEVMYLDVNEVE